MTNRRFGLLLLALVALPLAGSCATEPPSMIASASGVTPPLPPDDPPPASSFSVEFVPAGTENYPPTEAKDVVRFKNVLHWPGQPDEVLGKVQPTTRPYVRVGELKFGQSWYYHINIKGLVDTHVPRVGGDEVIRYTDR